jgi:cyclopropane-fatty-acyl-phospholipid synthase
VNEVARTRAERAALERSASEQREHERAVVAEHYQHDPEIFAMVLGRRLAYSTGIFTHQGEDLDTAQEHKLALIREWLAIAPGERVLDVGCGWGSILLDLAEHTQGHFHGLTLSERQRAEALRRAERLGVSDRVRIDVAHVEDLRFEPGAFDVVIFSGSIVHMHNRETIHQTVAAALADGGRMLISDCYFPGQLRGDTHSEATQYIFVHALGYCRLLHLHEELALIENAGLDVARVRDVTSSYVLTVGRWIDNVRNHRAQIDARAPGFARLLQTYMSVGQASFARRTALEYMILATRGVARCQQIPEAPR